MLAAVSSVVAASIVSETRPDVSISVEAISVIAQSDKIRAAVAAVVGAASPVYQIPVSAIDYIEIDVATALDEEGWYKLFQDATVALDQKAVSFAKSLLDQALASDDPTLHLEKALDDSVSTADALTILIIITRQFNDLVSAGDSNSFALAKALADAATSVDSKSIAFSKARSETATVSDSARRNVGKALSDSATPADANAVSLRKPVADSATAADTQSKGVSKLLVDAAISSDAQQKSVEKLLSDSQSVDDFLSRVVSWSREFDDTPVATDDLASVLEKALGETASPDDAPALGVEKIVADSVSTTESFTYQIVGASPQLLNTYVLNFFVLNGP